MVPGAASMSSSGHRWRMEPFPSARGCRLPAPSPRNYALPERRSRWPMSNWPPRASSTPRQAAWRESSPSHPAQALQAISRPGPGSRCIFQSSLDDWFGRTCLPYPRQRLRQSTSGTVPWPRATSRQRLGVGNIEQSCQSSKKASPISNPRGMLPCAAHCRDTSEGPAALSVTPNKWSSCMGPNRQSTYARACC